MKDSAAGVDDLGSTGGILGQLGFSGCVRLPTHVDAERIAAELARLPAGAWTTNDRDPFVHSDVHSIHALGERRGRIVVHTDDLPVLASLPALREAVRADLPGNPRRVVVARLPPGGFIPRHTDFPGFYTDTIRLSICITSDAGVRLHCAGYWYTMQPGEVWAVGNLAPHAVVHRGQLPRIHAIVDVEPDEALLALVRAGDADLGAVDTSAELRLRLRTWLRSVRARTPFAAARPNAGRLS